MSWFKNIMKLFGSHEEADYEESENNIKSKQNEQAGQMETKVTYQYPKGNFRFPLHLEEKNNITQTNSHEPKIKPNYAVKEKQSQSKVSRPSEKSAPRVPHERNHVKIEPKIKQPFRPTEIPSPVYGFNKPPKRIKTNDFVNGLKDNILGENVGRDSKLSKSHQTDFKNDEIVESVQELEPAIIHSISNELERHSQYFYNEPKDKEVEYEQSAKMYHKSMDEEDEQEQPRIIGDEIMEEEEACEQSSVKENEFMESIEQEQSIMIADETMDEETAREQSSVNENEYKESVEQEKKSTMIADETMDEETACEQSPVKENQFMKSVEQEQSTMIADEIMEEEEACEQSIVIDDKSMEVETEYEQTLVRDYKFMGEKVEQEQIPKINDTSLDELIEDEQSELFHSKSAENMENESFPSYEMNEVEPETESEEELGKSGDSSVRSHIPFNVIMLKKDREKLAHKQLPEELLISKSESAASMEATEEYVLEDYVFPSPTLLNPPVLHELDTQWVLRQSELLDETLMSFNVRAKVVNVSQGPSVTRFEVQPEPGVKVNKITNLSDDIKLSLAAKDIRIEAPIPGKHTIGIELPNADSRPVYISEIISSEIFQNSDSPLTAALGLDISGKPVITDLRKMPHGLIAGATGSGKSVCINSILVSLLYKSTPDELKLLMIDPKMVELAPYNYIPHLVSPVITDVKAATAALKWAVEEMERRYELFAHTGVREIQRYNELAEQSRQFNQKLPFIVIVIDELADLMMMAPTDVEEAICRIAQKARACGIHLIIATQRPSVDVITGLIKANVPTRIAFSVSSQVDSRTIIDISGAERLLGRGDMLFLENGSSKPVRLQGTYVSDEEIDNVVAHVRAERKPDYLFEQEELLKKAIIQDEEDEIFQDVCEFVMEQGAASTSLIQRNFRIGYNRAARLIEMMEQQGIISEAKGSKPRDILISKEEYEILSGTSEV
ncbi:DNA translocase FtsK [Bacillus sp. FJAT-49736]|uniref:DNA translocase FtsK n=1 Tax=Bacillus sp. FJAT-49736 TaxID=2833582 RepID=UPI001BC9DFC3|nr:DNA translocase FtsK [Bacillus sp. FJAT-49736]MBS4173852.1 DNA translocase FtsK [Bacillus sp. FJAT-49736]